MINMDMVGRMKEKTLYAAMSEEASRLSKAIESAAAAHGITLRLEGIRERRSDHVSFAESGYDTVSLSTGRHVDYHMPTDTPDQLNSDGMALVHDMLAEVIVHYSTGVCQVVARYLIDSVFVDRDFKGVLSRWKCRTRGVLVRG